MQRLVGLACVIALAVGLRAPVRKVPAKENTSSEAAPTIKDVAALHAKLENIVKALEVETETLEKAKAKIAPEFKEFVTELRTTLTKTSSPSAAQVPAAMAALHHAQAGVAHLTEDLRERQTELLREQNSDNGAVLMGVLMAEQNETMAKQLAVLNSREFAKLDVSKALLAKHDDKVPLFRQVASYMDAHGSRHNVANATNSKSVRLAATLTYFEKRVDKLKTEIERMEASHEKRSKTLQASIDNGHKKEQRHLQRIKKHVDRDYKKRSAMFHQQLHLMEDVVSSLKKGDMKALQKAEDALQSALKTMQSHTGDFLHLLQTGRRTEARDCPYCVAQCIEKCHDNGQAYNSCLTTCADAGK